MRKAPNPPGAQFEMIDGKPRSQRDRIEVAIEAAEFLKLQSGEVITAAYKADTGPR